MSINQLLSKVKSQDKIVLDLTSEEIDDINSNTNFYHGLIKKDNDSLQKIAKRGKSEKGAQSKVLIPIPEQYYDSLALDNSCIKLDNNNPPTIGCYTILNSHNKMNCCDFTIDGTMIAIGLKDGPINLWVLDKDFPEDISEELIKNLEEYKETHYSKMLKGGEIFYDMNNNNENLSGEEDKNAFDNIIKKRRFYILNGHSEAVYSVSFSPDVKYLVSGSFDESIRLWSTLTKQVLVVYKGHFSPVLQVKFSPLCHYFASGGCDRTAKVWSISSVSPIRQFAGHMSDVEIVEFHPNGLYLVTAADDKTIRIWGIETGECVRLIYNYSNKSHVDTIGFANSGKIMVVGCDCSLVIYDLIRMGNPIRVVKNFTSSTIYSICLNLEDTYIVASTQDQEIIFFDFDLLLNDQLNIEIDMNNYSNDSRFKYSYSYATKKTPIMLMKFNSHNILMTLGRFDDNDPKIFM